MTGEDSQSRIISWLTHQRQREWNACRTLGYPPFATKPTSVVSRTADGGWQQNIVNQQVSILNSREHAAEISKLLGTTIDQEALSLAVQLVRSENISPTMLRPFDFRVTFLQQAIPEALFAGLGHDEAKKFLLVVVMQASGFYLRQLKSLDEDDNVAAIRIADELLDVIRTGPYCFVISLPFSDQGLEIDQIEFENVLIRPLNTNEHTELKFESGGE